jgi:hypothetical protein
MILREDGTILYREDYTPILEEYVYTDIISPMVEEIKTFLGISQENHDYDDFFYTNIERSIVEIESIIEDKIVPVEIIEYADGAGTDTLYTRYRIVDLKELLYAPDYVFVDITELENMIVNNYSIVLRNGSIFPRGRKNIIVHYVAGYSTIPQALASAIMDYTIERYLQSFIRNLNGGTSGDARFGVQSKSMSEGGVNYSTSYEKMREKYASILKQFKNWSRQ